MFSFLKVVIKLNISPVVYFNKLHFLVYYQLLFSLNLFVKCSVSSCIKPSGIYVILCNPKIMQLIKFYVLKANSI